jgi:ribosome-binding factor A
MPREYARSQRVADQIQRELAQLVQRELSDPRLRLVSIAAVKLSRDLAYAQVYVTSLSDSNHDEIIEALSKAAGFLRHQLGKSMHLRVVPQLKFIYDDTLEKGISMSQLIDDAISQERDEE